MRQIRTISHFLISLFLVTTTSFAAVDFEDAIFPELVTSGRAQAMGNAYIAKVDDSASAFYNPAGLGTVRFPHLHISNLHLEVNKGWLEAGAGGRLTDAAGNIFKGFTLDGTRQLLVEKPGNISHARFSMMPNFTARYISFGYMLSVRQRAQLSSTAGAQYEYAWRRDHGPYGALNISLFGGVFKIGATATLLMRKEVAGSADPNTTLTIGEGDYNKGSMLNVTAGTKLTLPIMWLPTFAATIHNATAQSFGGASGAGAPDDIKQQIDVGFSVTPQIGKIVRWHWELNYKDVGGAHADVSTSRKLVFGSELDIARTFFVRAGYGDGYGTAGIGIRTRKLEFDLTTYAVEIPDEGYQGNEDRRFSMTISTGF